MTYFKSLTLHLDLAHRKPLQKYIHSNMQIRQYARNGGKQKQKESPFKTNAASRILYVHRSF